MSAPGPLSVLPWAARLDPDARAAVAAVTRVDTLGAGDVVVPTGDPAEALLVLVDGRVEARRPYAQDGSAPDAVVAAPGGTPGLREVLGGSPHAATWRAAVGGTRVLRLPLDALATALRASPAVGADLDAALHGPAVASAGGPATAAPAAATTRPTPPGPSEVGPARHAGDWNGDEYGRVSTLQRSMAADAFDVLQLRGDEAALDLGCGDGAITGRLADLLPRGSVLGLDPSPAMVAAARAVTDRHPTMTVGEGQAETLDADGRFDVVVSFNALHWVPVEALADVLRRIARALRPGGRALLQFVCRGPRESLESVGMRTAWSPAWAARFDRFDAPYAHLPPDLVTAWAAGAGLRTSARTVDDRTWDFDSPAAFAAWCAAGFRAWTDRLPAADRAAFVEEVVDAYARVTGSPRTFRFLQLRMLLTAPG